ncbi:hypothetical protein GEMRC1_012401 [Eukaryota sp. GEM-RC1]
MLLDFHPLYADDIPYFDCYDGYPLVIPYEDWKLSLLDPSGSEKDRLEFLKNQSKANKNLNSLRRIIKRRTLCSFDFPSSTDSYSLTDCFVDTQTQLPTQLHYSAWEIHPFDHVLPKSSLLKCAAAPPLNFKLDGACSEAEDLAVDSDDTSSSGESLSEEDEETTDNVPMSSSPVTTSPVKENTVVESSQPPLMMEKVKEPEVPETEVIEITSDYESQPSTTDKPSTGDKQIDTDKQTLPSRPTSLPDNTPKTIPEPPKTIPEPPKSISDPAKVDPCHVDSITSTPLQAPPVTPSQTMTPTLRRSLQKFSVAQDLIKRLKDSNVAKTITELPRNRPEMEGIYEPLASNYFYCSRSHRDEIISQLLEVFPRLEKEPLDKYFKLVYHQHQYLKSQKIFDKALKDFLIRMNYKLSVAEMELFDRETAKLFKSVQNAIIRLHKNGRKLPQSNKIELAQRKTLFFNQLMEYVPQNRPKDLTVHWSNAFSIDTLEEQWKTNEKGRKRTAGGDTPAKTTAASGDEIDLTLE